VFVSYYYVIVLGGSRVLRVMRSEFDHAYTPDKKKVLSSAMMSSVMVQKNIGMGATWS
jgi:hypothetical protein